VSALLAGLAGGLLEEPGWTGFAIPKLRMRYSVFATGLIVGLLWGAWHFIVAFWGSGTPSGEFSLMLFLPQLLFYVAVLPPYRMLMVWVYDKTESLLISMLMHASLTGSILFIFMPLSISGTPLLIWYLVLAIAFWVAVVIIFLSKRKSLEKDKKG
jgi:membrane protease YdiL (CAAX protease family)